MEFAPAKSGIRMWPLVMLIIGAIDSIRNLPATAMFGTSLIFFFVTSAIIFLLPAGLVSAELSAAYPQKAGIYHWAKLAFGEKTAMLAIWLQWINTMVWFPSILCFLAGTAAYVFNPELAGNKIYLVCMILTIFWTMTIINLKGIHTSVKFANSCALLGMVIPMVLIISLALLWKLLGKPAQIHFTTESLLPTLSHIDNWISLTAIMTSFLGIELATVHIKEVNEPHTTFPRALLASVAIILITMILGSLSIAIVLPPDKINLVDGVMQAFTAFFMSYHLGWCIPFITTTLLVGSLGNMTSWVISPAKGLLQAAKSGYLPKFLSKENEHGVASNLLITQAILVSIVCMAFIFMPSVNGSYWLLSALSTELYMCMYLIMFTAGIILKIRARTKVNAFQIPFGKIGTVVVCALGLVGCLVTLVVGFFPPAGVNVGDPHTYKWIFLNGIILMISPVTLFFAYGKYCRKS